MNAGVGLDKVSGAGAVVVVAPAPGRGGKAKVICESGLGAGTGGKVWSPGVSKF